MCIRGLLIVVRALLSVALIAGCPSLLSAAGDTFNATFAAVGGAHRMFGEGIDHPALKISVWSIDRATHEITVKFQVEDIFGKPVPNRDELTVTLPADGDQVERTIPFEARVGYFSVHALFESGKHRLTRWADLGVIPSPFPGIRPNSFFASNTAGLKQDEDLDFLQAIGMRVERAHFAPPVQTRDPKWAVTMAPGEAAPLDFFKQDQNWQLTKAHDLWILPVPGYSLAGSGNFDRTDLARKLGMYGPPGDEQRFINTWETILRRYPEITTYEFWNEPFQYYVTAALAGAYMGNAQWNIGYGPDWTCSNTAFAVMTHFLEDRVPLVDIWPQQELLWGGVFANPRFATDAVKTLQRVSELTARWNVEIPPERTSDTTKVALIWNLTGISKTQLDSQGELMISDASGLRAFDLTGREILSVQGRFILPFGEVPVYITSESLSVIELRDRIAGGTIRHVTPVNLYALSLNYSAEQKQTLSVRIENQLNRSINGMLTLRIDQSREQSSAHFAIPAGSLAEVPIEWPGIAVSAENQYPIT